MIRLATYNIAGIQLVEKRRALLDYCLVNSLDIVCLEEVTFNQCQLIDSHYNVIFNLGPKRRGTAILFRRGLRASRTLIEPEGRLISVDLDGLTVVCIYAPSGENAKKERNEFFRNTVPAYVLTSRNPVVLLGDFNAVEDPSQRRTNTSEPKARLSNFRPLVEMIRALELVDVWRAIRPNENGYTFHCLKSSARLDRIYASRSLTFTDIRTDILLTGDHQPVVGYINFSRPAYSMDKSHGLWKLNTSILSEERYFQLITDFIKEIAEHPTREIDVGHWWEHVFKPGVRDVTRDKETGCR